MYLNFAQTETFSTKLSWIDNHLIRADQVNPCEWNNYIGPPSKGKAN